MIRQTFPAYSLRQCLRYWKGQQTQRKNLLAARDLAAEPGSVVIISAIDLLTKSFMAGLECGFSCAHRQVLGEIRDA